MQTVPGLGVSQSCGDRCCRAQARPFIAGLGLFCGLDLHQRTTIALAQNTHQVVTRFPTDGMPLRMEVSLFSRTPRVAEDLSGGWGGRSEMPVTTLEKALWTPYRTTARIAMLTVGLIVALFIVAELRAHLVGDVPCPLTYLSTRHEGGGGSHDPSRTDRRIQSLTTIFGYAFWSR